MLHHTSSKQSFVPRLCCASSCAVYLPQNYTACSDHGTNPFCKGVGNYPYLTSISKPWAWSGKIEFDRETNLSYFTALIIEWFDRAQLLPYQLTMPTQGKGPTHQFGDWPVKYKAVPCPVGKRGIEVQFLDWSKAIPADSSICNNQYGEPCGGSYIPLPGKPMGYLKLMLTSMRIPVSMVNFYSQGKWQLMKRSGDGYWQPTQGGTYDRNKSPKEELRLKIYCADGSAPLTTTVIPGKMLCSYQDPYCLGVEQAGVQC